MALLREPNSYEFKDAALSEPAPPIGKVNGMPQLLVEIDIGRDTRQVACTDATATQR